MDENFNSLVEEQKEAGINGFLTKHGAEEDVSVEDMSVRIANTGKVGVPVDVNHPSFEKLAELAAVVNRFELDVITAAAAFKPLLERQRSKSDSTPVTRLPPLVGAKSCSNVTELSSDVTVITDTPSPPCSERHSPNSPIHREESNEPDKHFKVYRSSVRPTYENRRGFYRNTREHYRGPMPRCHASGQHVCAGYIWSGELPPRNYSNPTFSSKIFVGGVPWDITEPALIEAFSPYGVCRVEWPSREAQSHSQVRNRGKITGYVYIVFETERSVKSLLQDCSQQFGSAGEWYFRIKVRRGVMCELRQVQIIPWVVSDSSYIDDPDCRLDPKKTVFVGALHGMITAPVLFSIMNDLYGDVVFVGIDTDKHKYPIGSGRVTFRSHTSYFRAIDSAFLEIRTSKFGKKVQIDPFLEDSMCMLCGERPGPFFCRVNTCFRYFCSPCWEARHGGGNFADHHPLTRHSPRSSAHRTESRFESPKSSQRSHSFPAGNVSVAPLGGVAAVAAVAHGTVPRQQRHAYQYMHLPAPAPVFTQPLVPQQYHHFGSNLSPSPLISRMNPGTKGAAPLSYVHQRLY